MERKIKQRGKRLIWSSAFKIHVVKTLYEKNWTYLEAATYFNIKRKQTIGEWVRQFGNELRDQNAIVMVHQSSPTVAMDINIRANTAIKEVIKCGHFNQYGSQCSY